MGSVDFKKGVKPYKQGRVGKKGHILESEYHFLICMRYIEMNLVCAGMVEHPEQY